MACEYANKKNCEYVTDICAYSEVFQKCITRRRLHHRKREEKHGTHVHSSDGVHETPKRGVDKAPFES